MHALLIIWMASLLCKSERLYLWNLALICWAMDSDHFHSYKERRDNQIASSNAASIFLCLDYYHDFLPLQQARSIEENVAADNVVVYTPV